MVIKQKGNGKWEYCVYLGLDERGKKKYKRKSGFQTEKDCRKAANKIKQKLDNEKNYITLENICDKFLIDCENRGLRITTIYTYRNQIHFIENNFKYFNNKDIRKITVYDIDEFIRHVLTVSHGFFKRLIVSFMKTIFIYAKNNKYIKNNIFDNIKLPPMHKNYKTLWNKADLELYLQKLKEFKYYDIVILVLETGLRRGEVSALTWDCVDLNRGVIMINKSYINNGYLTVMHTPKTNSGIRSIALLNNSIEILRKRYKTKCSKYVFPDDKDKNLPIDPVKLYTSFSAFLKKHDMKYIRFHDLRHLHATLLLNNNVNYKILAKRLGHSNVSFTLQTYTHILPDYELDLFKSINIFQ